MGDVAIRAIPGFENYFAGDDGNVYRAVKSQLLPSGNYRSLTVSVAGKSVHRPLAWFVALAWVEGFEFGRGMHVRFKNGDTLDIRPENLEWVTPEQLARERNRRYYASVRARLDGDPEDPRHGTRRGYELGCKCRRCRAMGPVVNRRSKIREALREAESL